MGFFSESLFYGETPMTPAGAHHDWREVCQVRRRAAGQEGAIQALLSVVHHHQLWVLCTGWFSFPPSPTLDASPARS